MPSWIEVSLKVDGEAAEAVSEVLNRYGYQGVAIEHGGIPPDKLDEDELPAPTWVWVRAYIADDDEAAETKRKLEEALRYMNLMYPMPEPEYSIIFEGDWSEAWKKHYHPIRIGRRIYIRPLWEAPSDNPDDVEIALDPGMAFGTGTHPTTQLCLEALEDLVVPGARVLDLGTGSGILAIGAAKLGAGSVLGLDTDSVAVEVAKENIEQNGSPGNITIEQGSLENVIASARRFDLLVCNILASVIIHMSDEHLGDVVRPGGYAIFSGILDTQADDVETALRRTGLTPYKRRQLTDWVVIEAKREQE